MKQKKTSTKNESFKMIYQKRPKYIEHHTHRYQTHLCYQMQDRITTKTTAEKTSRPTHLKLDYWIEYENQQFFFAIIFAFITF